MRIFLSYARANELMAREVELALIGEGHEVFFDRTSLETGNAFHQNIRGQIDRADALVFLVSPSSIRRGSYALTELKFAQEKWRSPAGRVLPVLAEPTPVEKLPPYLRAVTVLDPVGNLEAEVAAAISKIAAAKPTLAHCNIRVLMHLASFVHAPERPAFFVNVTNLSSDRESEVTHVWMETSPKTHLIAPERPLPVRIRPFGTWETWIYIDQLPYIPNQRVYELARVRLSTGEVLSSTKNRDVPETGYVPGPRPT